MVKRKNFYPIYDLEGDLVKTGNKIVIKFYTFKKDPCSIAHSDIIYPIVLRQKLWARAGPCGTLA